MAQEKSAEGVMSAHALRAAREELRLTRPGLARLLRLGPNGERRVRRWEDGDLPVSGPASVAIEALLSGWRPHVAGCCNPPTVEMGIPLAGPTRGS